MKHQTQKITEHVMRLWSDAQQNGYLITGKSRAALITKDESEADKQLKSVWELTGKPVTVLLSDGRLGSSGAGADAELCGAAFRTAFYTALPEQCRFCFCEQIEIAL